MKLSKKFIASVKLNSCPAYKIAQKAGVHSTWLSKIMIGAQSITPNDERIIRLGEVLGLKPEEIFEEVEAANVSS